MALVELKNIKKSFLLGGEEVEILHGVNLSVEEGEFVAMMGPSGSGKSTTMNILGCLDRPTGGEYLLDGVRVAEMDSDELAHIRNRMIGFVFQGFNLLPKTTALENVELPLLYAGVPRSERHEKAKQALIDMGLQERLYHEPSQLSGGQQQRVAIARTLASSAPFILADEPTGNLDEDTAAEITGILKESAHALEKCVIVVTHSNELAKQADIVLKLKRGSLQTVKTR